MKEARQVVMVDSALEPMGAWRIFRIPKGAVEPLGLKGNSRRVVCSLNGCKPFQCALFPVKKGGYFITASKELRDKLKIEDGDTVRIELTKDTSKYGLPMSPEFREVLRQDAVGSKLFHAMTSGNQRLSIRLVDEKNDGDKRINRAMILLAYLKYTKGKFV